ncbi:uncharacterized protein N7473_006142 [Penicillium subrubescens]|uniref:uncharacterized protein n=1 Tax=Penicillium subrubescens TaxID=1316194 RepID=UPI002545AECB|nr:uncharacterized protein N7473_006142 [Penicillium subrubescens]KAJ5896743.1 hypothetical protein N7473_006142 [Penicillium subrubescens]
MTGWDVLGISPKGDLKRTVEFPWSVHILRDKNGTSEDYTSNDDFEVFISIPYLVALEKGGQFPF